MFCHFIIIKCVSVVKYVAALEMSFQRQNEQRSSGGGAAKPFWSVKPSSDTGIDEPWFSAADQGVATFTQPTDGTRAIGPVLFCCDWQVPRVSLRG